MSFIRAIAWATPAVAVALLVASLPAPYGGEVRGGADPIPSLTRSAGLHSGVWKPLVFSNGTSPSPRYGAAMAYDVADGYLLLFGGCGRVCPMKDTWELDLSTAPLGWRNLTGNVTTAPPARFDASIAPSPSTAGGHYGVVLFGGSTGKSKLNDTWYFVGGQWTHLRYPRHPAPSPRDGASMIGASNAKSILLFGGALSTGFSNETWSFRYGYGWTQLHTAHSPPARTGAGISYAAMVANQSWTIISTGAVLLSGGRNATTVFGDQWSYSGTAHDWSQLGANVTAPPPVFGAGVTWSRGGKTTIEFGGANGRGIMSMTWQHHSIHGGPWVWYQGRPSPHPTARAYPAVAFIPTYLLVMFGGRGTNGLDLGDTWTFVPG